jgi:hypothetical protein
MLSHTYWVKTTQIYYPSIPQVRSPTQYHCAKPRCQQGWILLEESPFSCLFHFLEASAVPGRGTLYWVTLALASILTCLSIDSDLPYKVPSDYIEPTQRTRIKALLEIHVQIKSAV